jgi:hypothetical protein
MGFGDFWKGGSEPMSLSKKTLCPVGRKWMYISNRRRAKKLIPVKYESGMLPLFWEPG